MQNAIFKVFLTTFFIFFGFSSIPTFASGDFNGSTNYVTVSSFSYLQNVTTESVNFWFKLDSGTSDYQKILQSPNFDIGFNPSCEPFIDVINIHNFGMLNSTDYCDDSWHMFTMTYDNTDVSVFIDSTQVATATSSASTPNFSGDYIFGYNPGNTSEYLTGLLSHFQLWNGTLTQTNINELYDCSNLLPNTSDQVAYWIYDDTSGSTVTDYGSNNADGTLSGSSASFWSSDDPCTSGVTPTPTPVATASGMVYIELASNSAITKALYDMTFLFWMLSWVISVTCGFFLGQWWYKR